MLDRIRNFFTPARRKAIYVAATAAGVVPDGEPYKINHNLRAGLTRLMLEEYPDPPFRPRRSKCDPARVAV